MMTTDTVYAGLFGMLSTFAGALIAYTLSFSRDKRQQKEDFRMIYSAIIADLKAIKVGFENSETYLPRFSSMNMFTIKGGHLNAPANISLQLEKLSHDLVRIEDITKIDHEFNLAVASTGQIGLTYNNFSCKSERKELIKQVIELIPDLITLLEEKISQKI